MIKIDRMELEDIGDNPKRLAAAVIDQSGLTSGCVPVREIALASDINEIREEELCGFEGALVATPEKYIGSILVNRGGSEKRKRFTIGHELGHFLIGSHKPIAGKFECTSKDMRTSRLGSTNRAINMEVQANQFSAELLMPHKLLLPWLKKRREADICHVVDLSSEFVVSREAAARRYVELADELLAIVFSHNGRVLYSISHDDFPRLDLRSRDALALDCLTARFDEVRGTASDHAEVDRGLWLSDPKGDSLLEQVLVQKDNYRMTLLSLSPDDDDDEQEDWEPPKFRK